MNVTATRATYSGLGALNIAGGVGALVKTSASQHHATPELVAGLTAALISLILLTVAQVPMPRPARAVELADDPAKRRDTCSHYERASVVATALSDLDLWQDEVSAKRKFADDPKVADRLVRVNEWRVEKAEFVHNAEVERIMERQRPWVLPVAVVLLVAVGACVTSLQFRSSPPDTSPRVYIGNQVAEGRL